jgi:hypothetical protein
MPAESGGVGQQWREPLDPLEDRHVVNLDTTLEQQLLDVSVRQTEPQVQPDRDHDHVR